MAVVLTGLLLLAQVAFDEGGPADDPEPAADEVVTFAPYVAPVGVWDKLAWCESRNDWSAVSRGGTYRGGLQFDQPTWRSYGGTQYASSAHLASRTQQIDIATRLRAARGYAPWPVCRRVIGV